MAPETDPTGAASLEAVKVSKQQDKDIIYHAMLGHDLSESHGNTSLQMAATAALRLMRLQKAINCCPEEESHDQDGGMWGCEKGKLHQATIDSPDAVNTSLQATEEDSSLILKASQSVNHCKHQRSCSPAYTMLRLRNECHVGRVVTVSTPTPSKLGEIYRTEVARWDHPDPAGCESTLLKVQDLLEKPNGGILIIVAPTDQLEMLEGHTSDSGYMDLKLGCNEGLTSVHGDVLNTELQAARMHREGDRDEQGRCCDGAFLISALGVVRRAMVKCKHSTSDVAWANHGTRHDAAIGIAQFLECAVVFVASEAGGVHVITAEGADQALAFKISSR